MSDKQLLPSERFVNAKNIALYINSELTGEKNILKPDRADNLFDFSIKFEEERNNSSKFCLYGKVESKWSDSTNLKIDFRIGDSTTNVGTGSTSNNYPFWLYDKDSGVSATSWSFVSKPLDLSNGDLSKNIYGKKKAQYFFPFELDLNSITNSNKSIFIKIKDIVVGAFCEKEFPFLYFNEDGNILEYGNETAEILDDGNIIEINNNYPFFYDRHWIRREIEPTGPPFVYFTQSSITFTEGDPNQPDFTNNKIIQFEVALNKPPIGIEKIKLSVLYGLNENENQYTNVTVPQDVQFDLSSIEWNSGSTVQTVSIKLNDDFYVEKLERLSLKIVPLLGVLPDPEKPQILSIYIQDNDIPSTVTFDIPSYQFTEPRQDINPLIIPIKLNFDRKLLVPNQSLEIYVDSNQTTCLSTFGFLNPNGTGYIDSKVVNFNMNDLSYTTDFYFVSGRADDLQTTITLRLRNFTSNVVPGTIGQSNDVKFVLYVDKNIDKNYVQVNIPFNKTKGQAVLRSVYNHIQNSNQYQSFGLKDYTTSLETFYSSSAGNLIPNTSVLGIAQSEYRKLIFEDFFKINIKNLGNRIIFNGHTYDNGDTLSIDVYSGFSSSVSSNQFIYDGNNFILKLPANENFLYFDGLNVQTNSYGLNLSGASIWGFQKCKFEITIENKTYNYPPNIDPNSSYFKATNLLNNKIYKGTFDNDASNFKFDEIFYVDAGNDNKKEIYYSTTQLKNVNSQIQFDVGTITVIDYNLLGQETGSHEETGVLNTVSNYSGGTLFYSPNNIYYPGVVIIPKPSFFYDSTDNKQNSDSKIFLSKEIPILENSFTLGPPFQNNPSYIPFLYPCTNYTVNLDNNSYINTNEFDFGQLFVQAGYYTRTINLSVQDDSFVAATTAFDGNISSNIQNGFLYNWTQANINTKNTAIIEIINDGIVPVTILNNTIYPNEKLWLSEFQIPLPNNSLIKNVVTSLDQLVLNLPTNYAFLRTSNNFEINKFSKSKYIIQFRNFALYNDSDGSFTNKIVNKGLQVEKNAYIDVSGSAPSYPLNKFYLLSIFNSHVFLNYRNNSWICDPTILGINLRSNQNPNLLFVVNGFIATASVNSVLKGLIFSSSPISSIGNICSDNGVPHVITNQI